MWLILHKWFVYKNKSFTQTKHIKCTKFNAINIRGYIFYQISEAGLTKQILLFGLSQWKFIISINDHYGATNYEHKTITLIDEHNRTLVHKYFKTEVVGLVVPCLQRKIRDY